MFPVDTWTKRAISVAVASTLSVSTFQNNAFASNGDEKAAPEKIIITGSRISRSQTEGATTVLTLTAEQIEKEGFSNVYDALISLTPHTGGVQGEQYSNSFTPNAQMINLRGFGPNRTLILMNGRRMADYPMPFNGESNFVDLSKIPTAMVQRIEILLGGASAIYGSDAIAGVVNIITKKRMEGWTATARTGKTLQGGGQSNRVQLMGGEVHGDFGFNVSFEVYQADMINGKDRDYLDDASDNPQFDINSYNPSVNLRYLDYSDLDGDGNLLYLPAGACENLGMTQVELEGGYCTRNSIGDESIRNAKDRYTLYSQFTYQFGELSELFVNFAYTELEGESVNFLPWWQSGRNGLIYDWDQGTFLELNRTFLPSEIGNPAAQFEEQSFDLSAGVNGVIFDVYDYEAVVGFSEGKFERFRNAFNESAINQFFLGNYYGDLGDFTGNPIYAGIDLYDGVDQSVFFAPLTLEQTASFRQVDYTEARQQNYSAAFSVTGDIMDIGDNTAQFASIAEWSHQEYFINLSNALENGELYNLAGTSGKGERDRYALGIETRWPITDELTVIASGRYDKYDDLSNVDDALTYNFGTEFRPVDGLLIRYSRASSFRAPDMHFMFADESGFFLGSAVKDPYLCALNEPNTDLSDCSYEFNVQGSREGSVELEEETGYSQSLGVVFEPTDNMSFSVDYYQLRLEDMVKDLSLSTLLDQNAACLLAGDTASEECALATELVTRRDPNAAVAPSAITGFTIRPINTSLQEQDGVDVSFRHDINFDNGDFNYGFNYSHVLDSRIKEFNNSPLIKDWRDSRANDDLRSRVRGNIGWTTSNWNLNLFVNRVGSTPKYDGSDRVDPWTTANMFVAYKADNGLTTQIIVNNVTDQKPTNDDTYSEWPYYNRGQYNAIGREVFLELKYDFE